MTRESIERFLQSECSLEEANSVIQYFEQHPEELDLYLSEEEWEKYHAEARLTADKSAGLWKEISKNTIQKTTGKVSFITPLLVAASIVLVLIAAWWFRQSGNIVKDKNQAPTFISKVITNNEDKIMILRLPDSSTIRLMPSSSIAYIEPFQNKKREVSLKGEAFFNVTKDSLQPFIVYSDAVSTRVLGTQFLVTAFEKEDTIKVALFSGHVIIEPTDSTNTSLKKKMELFPGDVFFYAKTKKTATIVSEKPMVSQKATTKTKQAAVNYLSDNNWYMFNNQSLAEVLDQLEVLYNQKIIYSKQDVGGLSFIGKIDRKDTLETILGEICKLNNLKVKREQSAFLISK